MRVVLRECRRWLTTALLLAPLLALGSILGDAFIEDDNFRVVTDSLYRAGQLRPDEWSESFEEHRYRSVINLRGSRREQSWYRQERAFAAAHGLAHYDVAWSATREPSLDDMNRLVAIMRTAPKPLLIHCKDGADRSGLAAALYLYAVEGRPHAEAAGQLSLWYGHFPWLTSRTGAMDRALADFTSSRDARDAGRTHVRPGPARRWATRLEAEPGQDRPGG